MPTVSDPSRIRLLGIGECMVELSPDSSRTDTGSGNDRFVRSFAGDVLNTLWYAQAGFGGHANATCGACAFFSALGTDPLSDRMVAFIEGAGIDCAAIPRIEARRPGLYMIHLDGAERSFSYWRDSSAARLLAADVPLLERTILRADAIYLSGITLAILDEAGRATLLAAMRRTGKGGATVAFDPNIRPILWEDAATMRATIGAAAACSTVVLPSFEDEAGTFGDATPADTARRYADAGALLVVVKNGEGPVTVYHDGTTREVPTPAVPRPVDTTGAGDSFNGAFLASTLTGGDVGAAVAAGQACAARVIRHRGALIAQETLHEA